MKCPYKQKTNCKHLDCINKLEEQKTLFIINCPECDYYDNGIVESRGNEFLGWILNLFKWK